MLNRQIIAVCSELHTPHTFTPWAIRRISLMLYLAGYVVKEDTNFSRPVRPTILRRAGCVLQTAGGYHAVNKAR
jgi:hypothetical protein